MLFVFDWDGTLSDSTGKIIACMQAAGRELGCAEFQDDEVREIIGLGLPQAVAHLCPALGDIEREQLQREYSRQFVVADHMPSGFFPQVRETLDVLRGGGHQLAVATGKSRRGLDRVLESLDMSSYFDATRCADETESKPDPLMLSQLLAHFGCDAPDAVMVGDTEFDMAMAQALEVPRVAVSFGAHHIDRLRRYNPVLCVDHIPQLLGLVR